MQWNYKSVFQIVGVYSPIRTQIYPRILLSLEGDFVLRQRVRTHEGLYAEHCPNVSPFDTFLFSPHPFTKFTFFNRNNLASRLITAEHRLEQLPILTVLLRYTEFIRSEMLEAKNTVNGIVVEVSKIAKIKSHKVSKNVSDFVWGHIIQIKSFANS